MADRTYRSQALTPEDRADLEETRQTNYADNSIGEVVVVDGYGIHLGVWSGLPRDLRWSRQGSP
jgi:hypothetical protein